MCVCTYILSCDYTVCVCACALPPLSLSAQLNPQQNISLPLSFVPQLNAGMTIPHAFLPSFPSFSYFLFSPCSALVSLRPLLSSSLGGDGQRQHLFGPKKFQTAN